jgi:hypothetical protein
MVPELILSHSGLFDDPLEKPSRKLTAVHRHDRRPHRCRMSQSDMASFLAIKLEASALQCSDDVLGLHARQPREHTLGNDWHAHRNAQRHGLVDGLIVRYRVAVGGKGFEVQFKTLFGVAHGGLVSLAPGVAAGQCGKVCEITVVEVFDVESVCSATDFHVIQYSTSTEDCMTRPSFGKQILCEAILMA